MVVFASRKIVTVVAIAFLSGKMQPQSTTSRALTLGAYLTLPCGSPLASAPMRVSGGSGPYCLDRSALVNQTDVVSAALDESAKHQAVVVLTLRDGSAQRLRAVTRKNIGLDLGVVLNGQLVCVAMIAAPSERLWISGLPQRQAEEIIHVFQRGEAGKESPPLLPSGRTDPDRNRYGPHQAVSGVTAPLLIKKQEPTYTARARAAKIQGVVVLEAIIGADGVPGDLKVVRSLDPELDANAIECAKTWRFRPARKNGNPVAVKTTLEITFRL